MHVAEGNITALAYSVGSSRLYVGTTTSCQRAGTTKLEQPDGTTWSLIGSPQEPRDAMGSIVAVAITTGGALAPYATGGHSSAAAFHPTGLTLDHPTYLDELGGQQLTVSVGAGIAWISGNSLACLNPAGHINARATTEPVAYSRIASVDGHAYATSMGTTSNSVELTRLQPPRSCFR